MINRSALLAGLFVRVDAINLEAGWVSVERDADGDVLMYTREHAERCSVIRRILITKLPCFIAASDVDNLAIPWRMSNVSEWRIPC